MVLACQLSVQESIHLDANAYAPPLFLLIKFEAVIYYYDSISSFSAYIWT